MALSTVWIAGISGCAALAVLTSMLSCSTTVRDVENDDGGSAATSAGGAGGVAHTGGSGGGRVCDPLSQEICYSGAPNTLNKGICHAGVRTCNPTGTGYSPCDGEVHPRPEQCETLEDEDCDGAANVGCIYDRCAAAPPGSRDGIYQLDLDGAGPGAARPTWCEMTTDGGGWALVYNSVGSSSGVTLAFWNIPYADRLGAKGTPALAENFYDGALYRVGREYRDEIEDLEGKAVNAMSATAEGLDPENMHFTGPAHLSGDAEIYFAEFGAGWSSTDFDSDLDDTNCARTSHDVTQHYGLCWAYNLGADAETPLDDSGWGPHLATFIAARLGLAGDGTGHTRVRRISRWTRW